MSELTDPPFDTRVLHIADRVAMSEPNANAKIVAEARAYVERYRDSVNAGPRQFQYIAATLAALDERDAEIARLRELVDHEAIDAAAETGARLRAPPDADVLERAARAYGFITMPDQVTLFPEQVRIIEGCARALQQYGDERAAGAEARVAADHARKLRETLGDPRVGVHVPPADWGLPQNASERAPHIWGSLPQERVVNDIGGDGSFAVGANLSRAASIILRYGDERAREATEAERSRCAAIDGIDIELIKREARAAAIEEALAIAHTNGAQMSAQWIALRIAALTPKPGSEP